MRYIKGFGIFWYDFVVGDDWTIAVGIATIMIVTYLLEQTGIATWWLFFPAICGLLFFTVKRAAHD